MLIQLPPEVKLNTVIGWARDAGLQIRHTRDGLKMINSDPATSARSLRASKRESKTRA